MCRGDATAAPLSWRPWARRSSRLARPPRAHPPRGVRRRWPVARTPRSSRSTVRVRPWPSARPPGRGCRTASPPESTRPPVPLRARPDRSGPGHARSSRGRRRSWARARRGPAAAWPPRRRPRAGSAGPPTARGSGSCGRGTSAEPLDPAEHRDAADAALAQPPDDGVVQRPALERVRLADVDPREQRLALDRHRASITERGGRPQAPGRRRPGRGRRIRRGWPPPARRRPPRRGARTRA